MLRNHRLSSGSYVSINFKYIEAVTLCNVELNFFRVAGGFALCSSRDRFEKKIGRKVALTRALALLDITKEERREIWNAYFSRLDNSLQEYIKAFVPDEELEQLSFDDALREAERRDALAGSLLRKDMESGN